MPADNTELLRSIERSLRALAASTEEIAKALATLRGQPRDVTQPIAPVYSAYLAGRWPRRDGDTYGIVAAQPVTPLPSPEPQVHADRKTGHLRSTDLG